MYCKDLFILLGIPIPYNRIYRLKTFALPFFIPLQ